MKVGSICSGIGAIELSVTALDGWEMAFSAEVEPFPCAVLMERFGSTKPLRPLDPATAPDEKTRKLWKIWKKRIDAMADGGDVPNLGDFTLIQPGDYNGAIDLLAGGTPCQDFSIAGLRKGLDGKRGNLSLEFAKLAYRSSARWILWENVPGVFSSKQGKDFAAFLSSVTGWEIDAPADGWKNSGIISGAPGCYGVAWRVLDVQYTRVPGCFQHAIPQRRRRVFVVGYLGDWRPAAAVLFERECLSWHPAPSRQAGKGVARNLTASTGGSSGKEQQHTFMGSDNNPLNELNVYPTIDASEGAKWGSHQWIDNQHYICSATQQGGCEIGVDYCPTITEASGTSGNNQPYICYENHAQDSRIKDCGECTPAIPAKSDTGGGNLPLIMSTGQGNSEIESFFSPTLNCDHEAPIVCAHESNYAGPVKTNGAEPSQAVMSFGWNKSPQQTMSVTENIIDTLKASHSSEPAVVCYDNQTRARNPKQTGNIAPVLQAHCGTGGGNLPLIAFKAGQGAKAGSIAACNNFSPTLGATDSGTNRTPSMVNQSTVRRLTPLECERLMGFPDNHTRIPWHGKPAQRCSDSPRYKACGNSMGQNVIRWLGTRIDMVEKIINEIRG